MSTGARIAVAVASGYLLGRTKHLKLAITVGSMLAGQRIATDPRGLMRQGQQLIDSNPELSQLSDQVRTKLFEAARAAAITTASSRLDNVSDLIRERTERLGLPAITEEELDELLSEEEGQEDEYGEEAEQPESEEAEAEPEAEEERPRRSTKKSTAKKSAPAKKSTAKKSSSAGRSTAKKSAPAKKSTAKKSSSSKKSASSRSRSTSRR